MVPLNKVLYLVQKALTAYTSFFPEVICKN